MDKVRERFMKKAGVGTAVMMAVMVIVGMVAVGGAGAQSAREATEATAQADVPADVRIFGFIAAAAAFGLAALAAGYAIANVGSAAMGAIGEKPEIAGRALIFIALAEGLAVFGFITALMILGKV